MRYFMAILLVARHGAGKLESITFAKLLENVVLHVGARRVCVALFLNS